MKLHVENFAKIKEADIEINGITVIAGENNTGKSTIGKIMYCLYSIFKDIDLKVNIERKRSIAAALLNNSKIRNKVVNSYDMHELYEEVMKIVNEIFDTDPDDLDVYFDNLDIDFSDETKKGLYNAISFDENKLKSLIAKKYLSSEFRNQFLPLEDIENTMVLDLLIKDKSNKILCKNNQIIVDDQLNLLKDCIYIDNPFSIDEMLIKNRKTKFDIFGFIIDRETIYTHDDFLKSRLTKSLKENDLDLIANALLDERLSKFKAKIKNIINGDFLEKENKFVFFDNLIEKEIELKNLSTGIKSLAIILKLIENRDINDKSMIALDEPEVHLHPKWQLAFAEILVLLQKEFDLNIVLTTHSPYFINAIEVYSAIHNQADKCKYYLAKLDESNKAVFNDVTTNTEEIYELLSKPLRYLSDLMYENR